MIEVSYKWSLVCFICWMIFSSVSTIISVKDMIKSYKSKDKSGFENALALGIVGLLPVAPLMWIVLQFYCLILERKI